MYPHTGPRVGLKTNVRKTVRMVCRPYQLEGTQSEHRCKLPGNYPVLTVVMVIYHYDERIWRIIVIPIFNITYIFINIYYPGEPLNIYIQ